MNNRLFLYSLLAFIIILIFDSTDSPNNPESMTQDESVPITNTAKNVVAEPSKSKSTDTVVRHDKLISIMTDTLDLKISLTDGTVVSAYLLQHSKEFQDKDVKVRLLSDQELPYIAKSDVQSNNAQPPANYTSEMSKYSLGTNDSLDVLLTGTNSDVTVTKKYTFKRGTHLIDLEQTITNKRGTTTNWRTYNALERVKPPEASNMLYTYTGAAFYDEDEKFNKIEFSEIEQNNFQKKSSNNWVSMIEHYFFTAWIPEPSTNQTIYTRLLRPNSTYHYLIGTVGDYKPIDTMSSKTFYSKLFVGPKNQEEISAIAPGLDLTVDYGVLTFLAAPLFWILDKIYYVVGNWGWAIVFLTLLIKLLFFKLSESSYKSMAKMKKLTPRMTALKERFGDDRKKFSEALMKIYKEEKVNPLGGCLPVLIQIPVFIALYWVIIESVEMRHAPFIGWIVDLSSSDPLYILPILMGISMYIQQKLNPAPTDAMQQKIFMALPFIFTFLFATFPSGLVLYWLTNNILSIGQQYIINKRALV